MDEIEHTTAKLVTKDKVSTGLRKKKSHSWNSFPIYLFILVYLRGKVSTIWPPSKLTGFFYLKIYSPELQKSRCQIKNAKQTEISEFKSYELLTVTQLPYFYI